MPLLFSPSQLETQTARRWKWGDPCYHSQVEQRIFICTPCFLIDWNELDPHLYWMRQQWTHKFFIFVLRTHLVDINGILRPFWGLIRDKTNSLLPCCLDKIRTINLRYMLSELWSAAFVVDSVWEYFLTAVTNKLCLMTYSAEEWSKQTSSSQTVDP